MLIRLVKTQGRDIGSQKANQTAMGMFFLMLTVLIMFRHESVGNDTRNYISYFKSYVNTDWSEISNRTLEVGYGYFNKIVSLISTDSRMFLVISALVVSAMIYPTYKRLCVDSTLTIILFCIMSTFVMMFSGIRQMLAIAIGFIAYEFTRKKKFIPFLLAVALATTMHASAFMIAIMYPAYHIKITKIRALLLVPSLGVLFIFNKPIFEFLSVYIEKYTRFEADISSTGAYAMLILFVVFTVFAFVIPDDAKTDKETLGLRNFLIVALALQIFAPIHMLAMRMNYYFISFIPLLLPKIIENRNREMRHIAIIARHIMVIFFTVYFFYNAYTGENNLHVFPYHFFWESV